MTKVSESGFMRVVNFFRKPRREQFRSLAFRWLWWTPFPFPVRLPGGGWFFARNDFLGRGILWEGFESDECEFVRKFVKPGMNVLDIGANQGFYTVLLSKLVGEQGHVLAFEPSGRERNLLQSHLRFNHCRNVRIYDVALGETRGGATLYVVNGLDSGCNSLRPPDTTSPTSPVKVDLYRLDDLLETAGHTRVDFIKMDVEGAEWGILKGAEKVLTRAPRPIILSEVLDQRTRPWGYAAKQILDHLIKRNFTWFRVNSDGTVQLLDVLQQEFDGNFVAVPQESAEVFRKQFQVRDAGTLSSE